MGLLINRNKTRKKIEDNAKPTFISTKTKVIFRDKADQLARQIEVEINKPTRLTPTQKEQLMRCSTRLRSIGGNIKNENNCDQIIKIIQGELNNLDIIICSESLYGVSAFIDRIDQLIYDFIRGDSQLLNSEIYDYYSKKKKLEDQLYSYDRDINVENQRIQDLLEEGDSANSQHNQRRLLEIKNEISIHEANIHKSRDQRERIRDEIEAIDCFVKISKQFETELEINDIMTKDVYERLDHKLDSLEKLGLINSEHKDALTKRLENYYSQTLKAKNGFQNAVSRGIASREDAQQEKIDNDANLLNPSTDEDWEEYKKKIMGKL